MLNQFKASEKDIQQEVKHNVPAPTAKVDEKKNAVIITIPLVDKLEDARPTSSGKSLQVGGNVGGQIPIEGYDLRITAQVYVKAPK